MQQTSTARWTITQILLFDFPRVSQTVDRRWRNGKEKKKKKEKEMFFTERKDVQESTAREKNRMASVCRLNELRPQSLWNDLLRI